MPTPLIRLAPWSVAALAIGWAAGCPAQVVTDGTVGPARALPGPNVQIDAGLGLRAGGNLLHSFARFDVPAGTSATFTAPAAVNNIVARVTGGSASNIDGRLATRVEGQPDQQHPANFYLVNRAGIAFGPDATLDVGGSFAVTTAGYVRVADGTQFNATAEPVLRTASPAAFGFASGAAGPIGITGSRLVVGDRKVISVVGGAVRIEGATLRAPGGRVTVAAAVGPGEVRADGDTPATRSDVTGVRVRSDVALVGTTIDVDGKDPARVELLGRNVTLDRASITGRNAGDSDGLGVRVDALAVADVLGSTIDTSASGFGDGGDVTIAGADVRLEGDGGRRTDIRSSASGPGATLSQDGIEPGRISVAAGRALLADAADLSVSDVGDLSNTSVTLSAGGKIRFRDSTVSLRAEELFEAGGAAGDRNIRLAAGRIIRVDRGSMITTDAFVNLGTVRFDADAVQITNSRVIAGENGGHILGARIEIRALVQDTTRGTVLSAVSGSVGGGPPNTPADLLGPRVELAGGLVRLPGTIQSAASRLRDACAGLFGGNVSSFVVTGRGGTPPDPAGWSADLFAEGDDDHRGDDRRGRTGDGLTAPD